MNNNKQSKKINKNETSYDATFLNFLKDLYDTEPTIEKISKKYSRKNSEKLTKSKKIKI